MKILFKKHTLSSYGSSKKKAVLMKTQMGRVKTAGNQRLKFSFSSHIIRIEENLVFSKLAVGAFLNG